VERVCGKSLYCVKMHRAQDIFAIIIVIVPVCQKFWDVVFVSMFSFFSFLEMSFEISDRLRRKNGDQGDFVVLFVFVV